MKAALERSHNLFEFLLAFWKSFSVKNLAGSHWKLHDSMSHWLYGNLIRVTRKTCCSNACEFIWISLWQRPLTKDCFLSLKRGIDGTQKCYLRHVSKFSPFSMFLAFLDISYIWMHLEIYFMWKICIILTDT